MSDKYGDWQIDNEVGAGGASQVFLVKHRGSEQIGALKRLKNPIRLDRFADEVNAVMKLDHPNIVKILDYPNLYLGRLRLGSF